MALTAVEKTMRWRASHPDWRVGHRAGVKRCNDKKKALILALKQRIGRCKDCGNDDLRVL